MGTNRPSLTVAVICFNEAGTLAEVVRRLAVILREHVADHEIVFVDDGSTDGSSEIADALAAELNIRVIRHGTNRGIGASLRTSYGAASKEWISVLPADLEFEPEDLLAGYELLRDGIFVAYYKTVAPPPYRRMITGIQRILNRILFGVTTRHVNWVKIIPTVGLRRLNLMSTSPVVDTELAIGLRRLGYRGIDIPSSNAIRRRRGGMTTAALLRTVVVSAAETVRLWLALR